MIERILASFIIKTLDLLLEKLIGKKLEEIFPFLRPLENLKIVKMYERRIKEKDQNMENLKRKKEGSEQKHIRERIRIITALKRKVLSSEKLIEKYDKPLNAILISYAAQKKRGKKGRVQEDHFIREELGKYNAKYLGGTDALIPPSKVPAWIKDAKDLKRWFKRNILRKRFCKIKFLALIDLKKKVYWDTYLPYRQKHPIHRTVGEVLSVEDLFTEQQIGRIALSEIILGGDIAWLASTVLGGEEFEAVLNNQIFIENKLNHPFLRQIANDSFKDTLSRVLSGFVENPNNVAKEMINEAKFWNFRLRGI